MKEDTGSNTPEPTDLSAVRDRKRDQQAARVAKKKQRGRQILRTVPVMDRTRHITWQVRRSWVPHWFPCLCNGGEEPCPICRCGYYDEPPCVICAPATVDDYGVHDYPIDYRGRATEGDLTTPPYLYHQVTTDPDGDTVVEAITTPPYLYHQVTTDQDGDTVVEAITEEQLDTLFGTAAQAILTFYPNSYDPVIPASPGDYTLFDTDEEADAYWQALIAEANDGNFEYWRDQTQERWAA